MVDSGLFGTVNSDVEMLSSVRTMNFLRWRLRVFLSELWQLIGMDCKLLLEKDRKEGMRQEWEGWCVCSPVLIPRKMLFTFVG